jgi:hypothetical protein
VDELELLLCVVQSLSRKRPPLVLGHHACVTQLLDVVDLRHPAHHLLTSELMERLEVEMPKPLVPIPGLIISMRDKAEGSGHLHVKHVQSVAPAVDLGEKVTATVLDPEHPLANLHSQAALIEPTKADDGVLEGRDVVDPMEQLVLIGLGHEHDGPDTADSLLNLKEPQTLWSRSMKCSTCPDMWCVASLSRYHPSSLLSSEPLPRKACASGSSMWSRANWVSGSMEWV